MSFVQQLPNKQTVFLGICLALLTYIFANISTRLLANFTSFSLENIVLIGKLVLWLFFVGICYYAIKIERQPLVLWQEKEYAFWVYGVSVIAILVILFLGIKLVFVIVHLLGLPDSKSKQLDHLLPVFKQNKFLLIFTAFTAGVTEELIFRAYLMPRIAMFSKYKYMPIIVSTLLFGLMHIGYGTLAQVIGPLYIGLIFGIYYYKFRNIKILIVCHFLWDLLALYSLTR